MRKFVLAECQGDSARQEIVQDGEKRASHTLSGLGGSAGSCAVMLPTTLLTAELMAEPTEFAALPRWDRNASIGCCKLKCDRLSQSALFETSITTQTS